MKEIENRDEILTGVKMSVLLEDLAENYPPKF